MRAHFSRVLSRTLKSRLTFGLGFVAFVVGGSLLLLAWLRQREREESTRLFQALAQADAEFVRRMNLPRSEKLASDLEQLVGMQIEFHPTGQAVPAADGKDRLVIPLDAKYEMVFTRVPPASSLSMRDPATRNAFVLFWLLAGLAGWLVVRERIKRAQSERLAMLGRVATSLAHDIKNPLASIQLHAQLMTPRDPEDVTALKLIESEAEVISGLVNQWLHLANPLPPKLVPLDAAQCVRAVLRTLEAQAQHAGVALQEAFQAPLPVLGDQGRLAQAFRNILVNGIQAMPSGGRLLIEAQSVAGPPAGWRLRFTDSGTGFSNEAIKRGSELFYSEKEGGMGLGLNIVANIIQAHGGSLEFFNNPKGGATVDVILPAHSV